MTQNYLPLLLFGSLMLRSFNPSARSLKNSISFGLFSPESFSSYASTYVEFCVPKKERNFPDFLIVPERNSSFFYPLDESPQPRSNQGDEHKPPELGPKETQTRQIPIGNFCHGLSWKVWIAA